MARYGHWCVFVIAGADLEELKPKLLEARLQPDLLNFALFSFYGEGELTKEFDRDSTTLS